MPRLDLHSTARVVGHMLAWLAAAVLVLVLAWVLSNLRDIDPVPRPAALALPAPRLVDQHNAFFALVGLRAAADREPAAAGQALWRIRLAHAAAPRDLPAAQSARQAESEILGRELPHLSGAPLVCDAQSASCVAPWMAQADALAAQRKLHATLGQRCESLLDRHFVFEERLPPLQNAAAPLGAHASGASACSRWLLSGAALAWAQKRPADAVMLMIKADRLNRGLLAGSHSLTGQMIALRVARDTQSTIAALATRDRAMAVALAPLLAPLPDQAQAARRWMAVESAFHRGAVVEIWGSPGARNDRPAATGDGTRDSPVASLFDWLGRQRIGFHPERTHAANDARWLRLHDAVGAGLPAAMAQQAAERVATDEAGVLGMLTWRNTMGSAIVAVGQAAYGSYVARHADLELQREAAVLAVQAAAIAAPERTAWTQRQALSPLAQGRLSWDTEGGTLSARPWQQDVAGGMGFNVERDAIRFTLPKL